MSCFVVLGGMYVCILPSVSQSEAHVMHFQAKKHLLLTIFMFLLIFIIILPAQHPGKGN